MNPWRAVLREGAIAGSVASVLSTAVLAALGQRQAGSAVAPTNAESHWLWGEESLLEDRPTLRHTLVGYVTHHLATVFWATLYFKLYGHRDEARRWPQALAGGAATGAAAALIDYTVVPKRLTPGFEHRVSAGGMVATFAALAAGVALAGMLMDRR